MSCLHVLSSYLHIEPLLHCFARTLLALRVREGVASPLEECRLRRLTAVDFVASHMPDPTSSRHILAVSARHVFLAASPLDVSRLRRLAFSSSSLDVRRLRHRSMCFVAVFMSAWLGYLPRCFSELNFGFAISDSDCFFLATTWSRGPVLW